MATETHLWDDLICVKPHPAWDAFYGRLLDWLTKHSVKVDFHGMFTHYVNALIVKSEAEALSEGFTFSARLSHLRWLAEQTGYDCLIEEPPGTIPEELYYADYSSLEERINNTVNRNIRAFDLLGYKIEKWKDRNRIISELFVREMYSWQSWRYDQSLQVDKPLCEEDRWTPNSDITFSEIQCTCDYCKDKSPELGGNISHSVEVKSTTRNHPYWCVKKPCLSAQYHFLIVNGWVVTDMSTSALYGTTVKRLNGHIYQKNLHPYCFFDSSELDRRIEDEDQWFRLIDSPLRWNL